MAEIYIPKEYNTITALMKNAILTNLLKKMILWLFYWKQYPVIDSA